MKRLIFVVAASLVMSGATACSSPMTTREMGAAVGTVGGAAVGGIVGSAVGHPGTGAAVGGALGLGTGALIGDRLQSLEQKQSDLDKQIQQNEQELQRQREELEQLKKETKER
jgi:outer membrane lipoprotein SlyB